MIQVQLPYVCSKYFHLFFLEKKKDIQRRAFQSTVRYGTVELVESIRSDLGPFYLRYIDTR